MITTSFEEGKPIGDRPTFSVTAAADLELARLIDHGFDPQDAAVLVVHLDPILLHTVLHTRTGPPLLFWNR